MSKDKQTIEYQNKAEQWLAEELVERVVGKALGRLDDECLGNYPRDVYFIGNLRPEPTEDADVQRVINSELVNKLAPVAFGIEARVEFEQEDRVEINVTADWSVYYRAFPTYDQQKQYQSSPQVETNEDDESTDSAIVVSTGTEDTFYPRFRKINCCARAPIVIDRSSGDLVIETADLESALDEEHRRAKEQALADPEIFRCKSKEDESKVKVPAQALSSPDAYTQFCASLGNPVEPQWRWRLDSNVHVALNAQSVCLFSLDFVNATPGIEKAENRENFLFDSRIVARLTGGKLVPFELTLAPRGFREDPSMPAKGRNCAVNQVDSYALETTHAPMYRQLRLRTKETPAARSADLALDPVPVLEAILKAMRDYDTVWEQAADCYRKEERWSPEFEAEFQADWNAYRSEIERFSAGIELVRNNTDVCFAFKLTNQVFAQVGRSEWRLFQIIFLVSQLPGLVSDDPDDPERRAVDIIYYPTGGGKTEAYLGAIVFTCFWDRLRGKTAGVTAWARFPLRLLTVQQMQRVADVIGTAELVRREQDDQRLRGNGIDGFAVGYFVGEGATPNEIVPPSAQRGINPYWSIATDRDLRQRKWKTIAKCPACKTPTVEVDFDEDTIRVIHRCTRPDCRFHKGILPVYIVDNEIFRYLPSVVVGTIDKLASLGLQRKLSLLLGKVTGRCSKHGYYNSKCCQKGCTGSLRKGAPAGVSGPTLFVQDELHLLKEGLGTFDSHYETLIQHLLRAAGAKSPLKIIASSATIEAFKRQVEHLYGRSPDEARVFPGRGPTRSESFYAESLNYPQRLYIGILPHNKTLFNAILEILDYYHRAVQDIVRETTGGHYTLPNGVDPAYLFDLYTTSLTYFRSKRDLSAIRTDVDSVVIGELQRSGYLPLDVSELTGSESTDSVTATLDKLDRPWTLDDEPQAVLATNMISHGVDIDRFNAMLFYGMPPQNSEYVQASSRVGRAHLGIVFTCLHPARERDQSHYSYFAKHHEFLGQMIEPVSINRWSKFSVDRTLPGVFTSILLQELSERDPSKNPNRFYMFDAVKRMISDKEITIENTLPAIVEAYQLDRQPGSGPQDFYQRIDDQLRKILYDQIGTNSASHLFVSDALDPKPMRSLREVDEQIEVTLDQAGTEWARTRGGK